MKKSTFNKLTKLVIKSVEVMKQNGYEEKDIHIVFNKKYQFEVTMIKTYN